MPIPQEHQQLAGTKAGARVLTPRPPVEASLGQAFGAEPKALSVVEQELDRGAGAIAEDIDPTFRTFLGDVRHCCIPGGGP